MPLPISLAHKLAKRLSFVRKNRIVNYLKPDGKTQITIEYDEDKPIRVDTIVVSAQHNEEISMDVLSKDIKNFVIDEVIPKEMMDNKTKIFINPTGRFVIGGPVSDSGLTGRKIIVDTYGGYSRHGGGAFSGKDPTKVDRSAAYAARYIAKNIVGTGFARKCEVQVAYAIGVAKPVSIMVDTFGTSSVGDEVLEEAVKHIFDLRPLSIIRHFNLLSPLYSKLAVYGHMGREDLNVKWENLDKVEEIKNYIESVRR